MLTIETRRLTNQSFIVANDGQFLGRLTLDRYDSESIINEKGLYGSEFSANSIRNKFSKYGSQYSSLSPYSRTTLTPPHIYLRGTLYGFLTKNELKEGKKVTPEKLIEWMKKQGL